jgi:hypothetical protein
MTTATTGIASLLLFGGRTLHSSLRIPLNVEWNTLPTVNIDTVLAEALRQLDVLIIDEISTGHKNVIHYVDNLLRSIVYGDGRKLPFGGKVSYYSYLLIGRLMFFSSDCDFRRRLEANVAGGQRWRQQRSLLRISKEFGLFHPQNGQNPSADNQPQATRGRTTISETAQMLWHWRWQATKPVCSNKRRNVEAR